MNPKSLFFVLLALVLLWGCAGNLTEKKAGEQGARQLTGHQLLKLIPDNTMHLATWNNDMRADVLCRADGKIIAENNRGEKSEGGWAISQGDKLCLRFRDWHFADKLCYTVFQRDEEFMAFRSDGGLEYNFTLDRMPSKAVSAAQPEKSALAPAVEAEDNTKNSWWGTLTAKDKPQPVRDNKADNNKWWKFWGGDESSGPDAAVAAEKTENGGWWNILTRKEKKEEPEYVIPEEDEDDEHWWDVANFWNNGPEYTVVPAAPSTDIQGQLYKTKSCPQCNLKGLDMHGAELEEADLAGADLAGANLEHANLAEANLEGANLAGANLAEASLIKANLSGADLTGANLHWAILTRANLTGAKLKDAYLVKADCYKADLTNADLTDALLQRANLDMAIGLKPITGEEKTGQAPPDEEEIREEDIK